MLCPRLVPSGPEHCPPMAPRTSLPPTWEGLSGALKELRVHNLRGPLLRASTPSLSSCRLCPRSRPSWPTCPACPVDGQVKGLCPLIWNNCPGPSLLQSPHAWKPKLTLGTGPQARPRPVTLTVTLLAVLPSFLRTAGAGQGGGGGWSA